MAQTSSARDGVTLLGHDDARFKQFNDVMHAFVSRYCCESSATKDSEQYQFTVHGKTRVGRPLSKIVTFKLNHVQLKCDTSPGLIALTVPPRHPIIMGSQTNLQPRDIWSWLWQALNCFFIASTFEHKLQLLPGTNMCSIPRFTAKPEIIVKVGCWKNGTPGQRLHFFNSLMLSMFKSDRYPLVGVDDCDVSNVRDLKNLNLCRYMCHVQLANGMTIEKLVTFQFNEDPEAHDNTNTSHVSLLISQNNTPNNKLFLSVSVHPFDVFDRVEQSIRHFFGQPTSFGKPTRVQCNQNVEEHDRHPNPSFDASAFCNSFGNSQLTLRPRVSVFEPIAPSKESTIVSVNSMGDDCVQEYQHNHNLHDNNWVQEYQSNNQLHDNAWIKDYHNNSQTNMLCDQITVTLYCVNDKHKHKSKNEQPSQNQLNPLAFSAFRQQMCVVLQSFGENVDINDFENASNEHQMVVSGSIIDFGQRGSCSHVVKTFRQTISLQLSEFGKTELKQGQVALMIHSASKGSSKLYTTRASASNIWCVLQTGLQHLWKNPTLELQASDQIQSLDKARTKWAEYFLFPVTEGTMWLNDDLPRDAIDDLTFVEAVDNAMLQQKQIEATRLVSNVVQINSRIGQVMGHLAYMYHALRVLLFEKHHCTN